MDMIVEEIPAHGQQRQLLAEPSSVTDSFLRSRADAVRQIERTIHELSGVFQQLAAMISEQGDMVRRIDMDVEMALDNVQSGENHIMKVWERTSGNRGLILKIFGVLIVFIILFVVIS